MLAVAAHDLGQYVKCYERGKKYVAVIVHVHYRTIDCFCLFKCRIVTDLGGKTRVMELMSHNNQEVRYRALLSVQCLVSQPWQSV